MGVSVQIDQQAGWVNVEILERALSIDLAELDLETLTSAATLYRGEFLECFLGHPTHWP